MPTKTTLMRRAEARVGAPLATYLPAQLNGTDTCDGSMKGTAHNLGISLATLGYWFMKLGIRWADVAVYPGDRVYAIDADGNERLALEV